MEQWNNGLNHNSNIPSFQYSNFRIWRQLWHTRKQEEVLGTAEIAPDSDWASNDSVGKGSKQETSWSVRKGLGFIPEKM
jgi:hypothetical protein